MEYSRRAQPSTHRLKILHSCKRNLIPEWICLVGAGVASPPPRNTIYLFFSCLVIIVYL